MSSTTPEPAELTRGPRSVTFRMHSSHADVIDVVYPATTKYEMHDHAEAYLTFVAQGEYREWDGTTHRFAGTGTEWLYPQGSRHAVVTGPETVRVLHVTDPLGEGWVGDLSPHRLGLLWQMSQETESLGAATPDDAALLHLESLALELRPAAERDTDPSWLAAGLARLREGYREPFRLESLAVEAGVHPSHFARAFKQHHGMTVGEYLRRIRVAAAVKRLEETDASLTEVALDSGFADQSHMGRHFRRYLGRTPRSVRERVAAGVGG